MSIRIASSNLNQTPLDWEKNLNNINCFSNEKDKWRNSKINFVNNYNLNINLEGEFITERGRINCSLKEKDGFYRWLGIQFVVKEK